MLENNLFSFKNLFLETFNIYSQTSKDFLDFFRNPVFDLKIDHLEIITIFLQQYICKNSFIKFVNKQ